MNITAVISVTRRLKVNILFFPIAAASILGGYFYLFAASYVCAFLHELTHVAAARRLDVGISHVEIQPFGICARLSSDIIENPVHEILIALAGPAASLAAGVTAFILRPFCSGYVCEYFMYCNFAMAAVNMIPALPLDGGRVLRAALTQKTGALSAYNLTVKISRIPVAILLLLAVYALLTARFNFSLIMIGVFLLGNLFSEQKNISRQALREILYYKDKLHNSGMCRTTVVTAARETPARQILKRLSYSNYYIIHVVDANLRICKTLTEGELLKALTERGIRISLGEI